MPAPDSLRRLFPRHARPLPSTFALSDIRLHVKVKLAALWTSLMFCFVYGDYFELYRPGKLDSIADGRIGPFAVTQGALVGTAILMIVPSLMGALTLLLPPSASRVANIVFGVAYAAVMMLAIQGTWSFYVLFGVVEIAICATIVVMAWRWPREVGVSPDALPRTTPA